MDKGSQPEDQRSAPKLDDLIVTEYEMRNLSEILKDWLPWRKKKRKRD